MADGLTRVRVGQPFKPSARAWNAMMEHARKGESLGEDERRSTLFSAGVVAVKNTTQLDLPRFSVLGVSGVIFTPTQNANLFKTRVLLTGTVPVDPDHAGRFVVLKEPIKAGKVGRAYIDGCFPAKLNVLSEADTWCDIESGVTGRLQSGGSGGAKVLYKEPGTGEKLAVVHIAGGSFEIPTPQYPGMAWIGVAGNQAAFAYPFAVATV